jgi:hypothetical protein
VSASVRKVLDNSNYYYEIILLVDEIDVPRVSNIIHYTPDSNPLLANLSDFDFQNTIIVGKTDGGTGNSFTGYIRELKLFSKFHSEEKIISDKMRENYAYSHNDPFLIAYWKFEGVYDQEGTDCYWDRSYNDQFVAYETAASFPVFLTESGDPNQIELLIWEDVGECIDLFRENSLQKYAFKYDTFPETGISTRIDTSDGDTNAQNEKLIQNDRISFTYKGCESEDERTYLDIALTTSGSIISEVTNASFEEELSVLEGMHIDLCYESEFLRQTAKIGQIYLRNFEFV